ncbi:TPA: hypothetical protein ACGOWE_001262 [Streptococcus suis]|uniref:hypothetical protein n=1 Tax=Streptococcus parasuis TaxID=1501662 RepID=UPI001552CBA2|nr:hypothetical protein [Streptococcus suis]BCP63998.1 hypothetical protein SUT503_10560 [Streptococcus parasuis]HEM3623677.1 hypothetical protein [Streptococcus suis]
MNKNFLNLLRLVAQRQDLLTACDIVMKQFELSFGANNKLYEKDNKNIQSLINTKNQLIDRLDISNPTVKILIDVETASPFSIFDFILKEDFSDIMFFNNGYKQSDNTGFKNHLFKD